MVLYLVRHGETDWNRLKKIQGQTDVPLNETGKEQARKLAMRFSGIPVDFIYSSDLSRAYETGAEVGRTLGIPVHACDQLRERSFGRLEGYTAEEIERRFNGFPQEREQMIAYGMETKEETERRIYSRLKQLMEKHFREKILVVSHGGSIRSFVENIAGERLNQWKLDNTGINHIIYQRPGWQVIKVNDISHLNLK